MNIYPCDNGGLVCAVAIAARLEEDEREGEAKGGEEQWTAWGEGRGAGWCERDS